MGVELMEALPAVDAVLETHVSALGADRLGYRNHVYRVVNFAAALSQPTDEGIEKLSIAAAFHDLGIWTAGTFDYLAPSTELALAHLEHTGRAAWRSEIAAMIEVHHKVTAWQGRSDWLVEPFRRADWIDVTLGLRHFGIGRELVSAVRAAWPDAGFHWRLVTLAARRLATHPLRPLPMLRR